MHLELCEEDACAALIAAALPGARVEVCEPLTDASSACVARLEVTLAQGTAIECVLNERGEKAPGLAPRVEFELLGALHACGLPVPRPVAFGEWHGENAANRHEAPFILCEYVAGRAGISAPVAEAQIEAMAWQLAAIHAAPLEALTGLPDLPERADPQGDLSELLPRMVGWTRLRARIEELGPQPFAGKPCLLHGDFWPANIVWHEDRIAAVLNWNDAAIGDPLSDVARTQLELVYIFGPWGAARFAEAYAQHRALDPVRLAWWQARAAAAAARAMAGWGLAPSRLATMRAIALDSVHEAAGVFAA
jgi:aminoglycoside phosphotransferase (APT) family kinase protein